jgi:hypothetical protein
MKSTPLMAAVAACAAILATPAVANAESSRTYDHRRDVIRFPDSPDGVPAPRNARADITRSVMRYTDANVSAALKIRSLRPPGINTTLLRVRTSNDSTYLAFITVEDGGTPTVELLRGSSTVTCDDTEVKFKPVLDRVSVGIPATCLGSPNWVRVGASQTWASGPGGNVFADDARLNGRFHTSSGPDLGPRLSNN